MIICLQSVTAELRGTHCCQQQFAVSRLILAPLLKFRSIVPSCRRGSADSDIMWIRSYSPRCCSSLKFSKPKQTNRFQYMQTRKRTHRSACASSKRTASISRNSDRELWTGSRYMYLRACVASGYWSVIKSLHLLQGQFFREVIMLQLCMTASVNHKWLISCLHTRDAQTKLMRGEREGLRGITQNKQRLSRV